MYMEKEMDAGDILGVRKVKIEDSDTCGSMFNKLSLVGRDLLLETIDKLVEGKITPIKQNENEATFAYNVTKEEELIDFNEETATDVFNHVRAYNPNPVAHMLLKGEPLKIYETRVYDYKHNYEPGKIFVMNKNHVYVACKDNTTIELVTVQPVGKKPMPASDFANGALRKYL